jgi:hypothetical protein
MTKFELRRGDFYDKKNYVNKPFLECVHIADSSLFGCFLMNREQLKVRLNEVFINYIQVMIRLAKYLKSYRRVFNNNMLATNKAEDGCEY